MTNPALFYLRKDAKLPFEIIKGSEKERFKKAYEMNKKIFDEINQKMVDNTISVSDFSEVLNKAFSPYHINYSVKKKEKILYNAAAYMRNVIKSLTIDDKLKVVYLDGYEFAFNIQGNRIINDKYDIFHEIGHLLDDLFTPKYSMRQLKNGNFSDKTPDPSTEIIDRADNYGNSAGVIALFDLVYDMAKIKSLADKLPDKEAIDTLQCARMRIKGEINQYNNTLKMYKREPLKNYMEILRDSFFIFDIHLNARYNLLSKLLKHRIAKVRKEHKANLEKNI